MVAWFAAGADLARLREVVDACAGTEVLSEKRFDEEPWVERQEASRRPLAVGKRFLIVPEASAVPSAIAVDRVVLVVPPKRAFGTGEHETTRQCVELLEEIAIDGLRVLDLGTGSGILAMAAGALGAAQVVGVDDDPEAVEMARENLAANPEPGAVVALVVGREPCLAGVFDVLLANLYAGVLETLAPRLAVLQPCGAAAILSGFSPQDAESVSAAWCEAGYREARRPRAGEWAALLMVRV
jgi:ribosomal protein L11 methyltransferase